MKPTYVDFADMMPAPEELDMTRDTDETLQWIQARGGAYGFVDGVRLTAGTHGITMDPGPKQTMNPTQAIRLAQKIMRAAAFALAKGVPADAMVNPLGAK